MPISPGQRAGAKAANETRKDLRFCDDDFIEGGGRLDGDFIGRRRGAKKKRGALYIQNQRWCSAKDEYFFFRGQVLPV